MFFFVDDNIIGYSESSSERAIELFKGMIRRGIKKDWFCQASLNFADNEEVLKYAAKSGCRMVVLGLEAENIESLREANKNLNLKMAVVEHLDRPPHAVSYGLLYGVGYILIVLFLTAVVFERKDFK